MNCSFGNPFDPYAVKVMDSINTHLGFIAKDWAAILSNKLDKGFLDL
ncbi:HIRAN domain-containing protein [Paenibacillus macerans]